MSTQPPPPQVWPSLRARDARGLIKFLVNVVGFKEVATYADGDQVHHCQLAWPEGGGVMLGSERDDGAKPAAGSFSAYVVSDHVDAIHDRVSKAGAKVVDAPHDTDYGSHDFALEDPEGNRWSFGTYRGEPVGE